MAVLEGLLTCCQHGQRISLLHPGGVQRVLRWTLVKQQLVTAYDVSTCRKTCRIVSAAQLTAHAKSCLGFLFTGDLKSLRRCANVIVPLGSIMSEEGRLELCAPSQLTKRTFQPEWQKNVATPDLSKLQKGLIEQISHTTTFAEWVGPPPNRTPLISP